MEQGLTSTKKVRKRALSELFTRYELIALSSMGNESFYGLCYSSLDEAR